VVDREVEEEAVEMRAYGISRGRQGSYIDKTRNRQAPLPPPTTPRALFREQNHPKRRVTFQLRGKVKGQG
jgi:hypothetical protein